MTVAALDMADLGLVLIGAAAIALGLLVRHELRLARRCRRASSNLSAES